MTSRRAITIARRLTIVLLGAVLAASATLGAADTYWRQNAADAPFLVKGSPAFRMAESEALRAQPGWLVEHAAAVRDNAREVLRHEPLDAVALRQLGEMQANLPGKVLQLLRLSERVTRREPIGQVMLINLEARANNTSVALAHYDRALSVLPQLGPTLIPVLANGLWNPDVVEGLSRFSSRPWFRALLGAGLESGAPVSAVARLALSAQSHLPVDESERLAAELIDKLLALNRHDDVRAFILNLAGPERLILNDLAINPATTFDARNSPLAWRLTSDDAITSEFVPPSGLAVTVSPSSSGVAISRLTLLRPGRYTLLIRFSYSTSAPRPVLAWDVACSDGRTIWRKTLPPEPTKTSISTPIIIPGGCSQQSWRLDAGADDSQFASTARIDSLSLVPL